MADLFGRYVFRQVAGSFLLILLTLMSIVWLATALKQLDLLTSKGQSIWLFLTITSLALPNLMAVISPNALLMGTLYTLDRLNGDSELIVTTAAGAPIWRIAAPFLLLASLVSVLLVIVSFWLLPASMRTLRSYVIQVRTDLISQVLQPGRFSSPESDLTFHIRDRTLDGDLLGLLVHDTRDSKQAMTYLAKRGRIVKNDDGAFLVMQGGQIHRQHPNQDDKSVQIVEFEQYIFDISQFGPKSEVTELKPRERYLGELLYPDPEDSYYKRYPLLFPAEVHNRFSNILYPFVFVLIPIMFLGQARTIRQGRWNAIVLAFGCAVMVRVAGFAATNLNSLHPSAVVLVYGVPLGAILVAALVAHARMAPQTRFGIWFELLAKLKPDNNNFWSARGIMAGRRRGRVG